MRRFRYIILMCVLSGAAHARPQQEIIKIYSGKQWNLNDPICFHRDNEIVACGRVVGSTSYLVSIRVPALREKVRKGERLYVSAAGPGRSPTDYGDSYVVTRTVPLFLHGITTGAFASTHLIYPMVNIQTGLGKGVLLGVMPSYANPSSANLVGTFLTFEGYFNGVAWDGFYAQLAAGAFNVSSNGSASWVPSAQAGLGWRVVAHWGFTVGLVAGGQYTSTPSNSTAELSFTGFQPLFRADIGVAF